MEESAMKTQGTNLLARVSVSLLICGLIVFSGFQVFGQQWTAEQKEIWKLVETEWELIKKGDVARIMRLLHDNSFIWWLDNKTPLEKEMIKKGYISFTPLTSLRR